MNKDAIIEKTLVLRSIMGDDHAFERLVTLYNSKLTYYVRRLIPAEVESDDLLQTIWLAVWRQLPKLKKPDAFRAWLYRIARNTALQTYRIKIIEVPLEDNLPSNHPDETAFSPEEAQAIHAALERLTSAHRDVLVLRFLEEMNYEEIAAVVDCSVGTVRSRLYYAKKRLRNEMEDMKNE